MRSAERGSTVYRRHRSEGGCGRQSEVHCRKDGQCATKQMLNLTVFGRSHIVRYNVFDLINVVRLCR